MSCSICHHPHRRAIDLALLSGSRTLRSLEQQYGSSRTSFWRHKNHLEDRLFQARERFQRSQAQVSLLKLNGFLDQVEQAVQAAAADGQIDRVFKGSYIGSRILCQINKLEAPLDLETFYRLLSSPEFVSRNTLLPAAPDFITELHQALVDKAMFPCPEPPPEISAAEEDNNDDDSVDAPEEIDDDADGDDSDEAEDISTDSFLKTRNPKLETQQAQLEALRLLQKHFPDLELPPAVSATKPGHQRDKSVTKARQTRRVTENISEKQEDILSEKKLVTPPSVGRESGAPPAISAGPLAILDSDPPPASANPIPDPCFSETANQKPKTENRLSEFEAGHDHAAAGVAAEVAAYLAEIYPKNKRHKSTTKAPQTSPATEAICENQEDILSEKNLVTPPSLPRANAVPPATSAGDAPAPDDSLVVPDPEPAAPQAEPAPAAPDLALLFSNSADDLFEITHGYKRHNPPKHIPYRHRDEDFRSTSIFGDPRKIFG